ncbi:hypothetical protein [Poseidonibacter ostreae]|nr:hypothetical protein [Poseidonibacter ostreae]
MYDKLFGSFDSNTNAKDILDSNLPKRNIKVEDFLGFKISLESRFNNHFPDELKTNEMAYNTNPKLNPFIKLYKKVTRDRINKVNLLREQSLNNYNNQKDSIEYKVIQVRKKITRLKFLLAGTYSAFAFSIGLNYFGYFESNNPLIASTLILSIILIALGYKMIKLFKEIISYRYDYANKAEERVDLLANSKRSKYNYNLGFKKESNKIVIPFIPEYKTNSIQADYRSLYLDNIGKFSYSVNDKA